MIVKTDVLEPLIKSYKARGKRIVLTGGCFDILHNGHIEYLTKAKREGTILVILLESDENIRKLKGADRPINTFEKRAIELEKLGFINLIVELSEKTSDSYYYNLTKLIQPDIIAITKNDSLTGKKREQAKIVGGKIKVIMERDERYSSTKLTNNK